MVKNFGRVFGVRVKGCSNSHLTCLKYCNINQYTQSAYTLWLVGTEKFHISTNQFVHYIYTNVSIIICASNLYLKIRAGYICKLGQCKFLLPSYKLWIYRSNWFWCCKDSHPNTYMHLHTTVWCHFKGANMNMCIC